jgi:hypothetical protein
MIPHLWERGIRFTTQELGLRAKDAIGLPFLSLPIDKTPPLHILMAHAASLVIEAGQSQPAFPSSTGVCKLRKNS